MTLYIVKTIFSKDLHSRKAPLSLDVKAVRCGSPSCVSSSFGSGTINQSLDNCFQRKQNLWARETKWAEGKNSREPEEKTSLIVGSSAFWCFCSNNSLNWGGVLVELRGRITFTPVYLLFFSCCCCCFPSTPSVFQVKWRVWNVCSKVIYFSFCHLIPVTNHPQVASLATSATQHPISSSASHCLSCPVTDSSRVSHPELLPPLALHSLPHLHLLIFHSATSHSPTSSPSFSSSASETNTLKHTHLCSGKQLHISFPFHISNQLHNSCTVVSSKYVCVSVDW